MQRSPQENRPFRAKRRGEIRPHYGMPRLAALAALVVAWATAGCFNVDYGHCRITCSDTDTCPRSLMCIKEPGTDHGLCAQPGMPLCGFEGMDGGSPADAMDAPDVMDENDASDVDRPPFPPEVLCHNGPCLILPEAIRTNLVLLLWPSNLPPVGSTVSVWPDQSGNGNNAEALHPTTLPVVIPNGVHLDPSLGSGFFVFDSPSLDFGSGDFAIIVVAGLSTSATRVSFFRKSDNSDLPASRQVSLGWAVLLPQSAAGSGGEPQGTVNTTTVVPNVGNPQIAQPSVGVYTFRRATDQLEIRFNGTLFGSTELPTPGVSTSNADDVYIGVTNTIGKPADSIEAVIAIRGSVGSTHLEQLESFLRTLFATAAP
jgi:hypothetical protein